MWFLGVLVGLGLGAAFNSLPAALILGGIGGFLVALFRRDTAVGGKAQTAQLADLQRKVVYLYNRLEDLEARLAGGIATDAASPTVSPSGAPQAVEPNVAGVAPETPVQSLAERGETVGDRVILSLANAAPPPSAGLPVEAVEPEIFLDEAPAETAAPRTAEPVIEETAEAAPEPEPAVRRRPPPEPAIPLRDRLPAPLRELIFGGNTLVKLGVLILFIGLAFLLRYTAERVTVPIEFRYAGVALTGAGLLVAGWFLRRRRPDYALVLQGGGIGVFYLTTLAAMKFHALLPADTGFIFMSLVALLSAALAVLQNARILAVIAAVEGFATPVLVSTGGSPVSALLTYLAVLDIGICAVAWFRAWRVLNLIGFVGTSTLIGAWARTSYQDALYGTVQPFLVFFLLLFTLIGLRFAINSLRDAEFAPDESLAERAGRALRLARVDSALVFGTPLTTFGLQYLLVKPWEYGSAFAAIVYGLFYLLLARLVYSPQRPAFALLAEAYAIVGVIFGTLAIPLGLEGQWTGAAWAIEGAGMYWLGVRQHRGYARAFAFVVLAGATVKLLAALSISAAPTGPVLEGSIIGPLLLAASALAMWLQQRRADLPEGNEREIGRILPWLAVAALTLVPWLVLAPAWAAAATAILALAVFALAVRLEMPALRPIVGCQQALAVIGFMLSLHHGSGQAVLESGASGIVAAVLIAASLLATAGWNVHRIRRLALACGQRPRWSLAGSLGMVAGLGLLHLAMLFGISLEQAALWWPLTATLAFWVALRVGHGPLAFGAGGIQLAAAAIYGSIRLFAGHFAPDGAPAFAHAEFFTPLAIGVAALLSAYWIFRQAPRDADTDAAPRFCLNLWCASRLMQWVPLVWGLAWWTGAWMFEADRVLTMRGQQQFFTAAWIDITLVTSFLLAIVALWRGWRPGGMATAATLPMLALAAWGMAFPHGGSFSPAANLGWVLWPIALLWHLRLLFLQERWLPSNWLAPVHVAGFWLFLALATQESQMHFGALGMDSWRLLGVVLVPAVVFWSLRSSLLERRWPLAGWRSAYLIAASAPVALYLALWVWITNLSSPGNAAPLPYLPLLNPLEIGHWLVLAALALWWRAVRPEDFSVSGPNFVKGFIALTALALATGTVLRSCHHFGGVEWTTRALLASRLTQAALAIGWSVIGVVVMVLGTRRGWRPVWLAGALLLAVVVVKLFLVDLADHGGLYRVISFIGVGALLLLVGYFAPVPPKAATEQALGGQTP